MKLYIEIQNGQPINHPAFEDNLIQAFGKIPNNWEAFTRIERPTANVYEVLDSETPTYSKINDVWSDVWSIRNMTAQEKTAKQQAAIAAFNDREQASNWSAWVFDEATCMMQPPIPRPDLIEGKLVFWCGADGAWKEAPSRPEGQYKFDFISWEWITSI